MASKCQVTGKRRMSARKVSHSNIKTKSWKLPNMQKHRFWLPEERRWVNLRVTAHGIKVINKRGIGPVVAEMRARGEKI